MSNHQKFPASEAWQIARPLSFALQQVCERVEIAGSLRRKRPEVGDIEILFIPRITGSDFFEVTPVSLADGLINAWLDSGLIAKRPSKTGVFSWGDKNKLAVHVESKIPIDFFSTTQANWWNSLVCRTGGKDNNLLVTNTALAKGYSFEAYGSGFHAVNGRGERHDTTSERDVFEFIGLPYKEPQDRL